MDAQELHRRCFIADAHADALMWNRDLCTRSETGHVDFPRLFEAGVKLQCFTLVTRGFPFIGGFNLFARRQRWPREAIRGEWARAGFQIDLLESFCQRSEDRVRVARSASDLEQNEAAQRLSAVLGVEGAHALEGKPERVAQLFSRGVRFMSLTHLSNNELGGSSFPLMGNRGLSPLGRQVLDQMSQCRMSVDVAHASERTLDQIFEHKDVRVMCSHTGIRGARGLWRNLSDRHLRAIADRGGVVGVIFAPVYLGGDKVEDVVRHIEHALSCMGEEGVALGSDFDGMVPLPKGMRDVRDLHLITTALLKRGHPTRVVERVMGANWQRYFLQTLG